LDFFLWGGLICELMDYVEINQDSPFFLGGGWHFGYLDFIWIYVLYGWTYGLSKRVDQSLNTFYMYFDVSFHMCSKVQRTRKRHKWDEWHG
jgi:hypothetical protein